MRPVEIGKEIVKAMAAVESPFLSRRLARNLLREAAIDVTEYLERVIRFKTIHHPVALEACVVGNVSSDKVVKARRAIGDFQTFLIESDIEDMGACKLITRESFRDLIVLHKSRHPELGERNVNEIIRFVAVLKPEYMSDIVKWVPRQRQSIVGLSVTY